MSEGRRPYARAVRNRTAIAHQVVTIVALGGFNGAERFTRRQHRSPAHAQEVRDQGFDVVHGAVFRRRSGERMIGFIRTLWHVPHALLNDAQALPHLFDTNCGTVVAVAILRRWNVELKLFVSGVGLPFAKIPFQTTGPEIRTGNTPFDSLVDSEAANPLGAPERESKTSGPLGTAYGPNLRPAYSERL
jgi:hypothetical protein